VDSSHLKSTCNETDLKSLCFKIRQRVDGATGNIDLTWLRFPKSM